MAQVRSELRDSFREFEELRREIDRLFDDLGRNFLEEGEVGLYPALNITEDRDCIYVEAELPGVRPEDIDLSINQNTLIIEGERRDGVEGDELRFFRKEIERGRFSRAVSLPVEVDPESADASLRDGILYLKLPKSDKAKPKQIPVKS